MKSDITILPSASRTATTTSTDIIAGVGAHIVLDMTAVSGTPSITYTVQGKDKVSGKYYNILTSAAITTVSTNIIQVYPGIPETANVSESSILPGTWRVIVTHSTADAVSYSVGASTV